MKNKKIIYLLIVALTAIILILLYALLGDSFKKNNSENFSTQKETSLRTFERQTSEGAITVDVEPKSLTRNYNSVFEITFTAHSGDPSYDPLNTAKLIDDQGSLYQAVSWDGDTSGHHAAGTLKFSKLSKSANKITLILPNIDNKDRKFTWNL